VISAGRLLVLSMVVAVVVGLSVAGVAGAAVSSTPDPTYAANGSVFAVARTPSTIYLGGSFSQVGPRTGPWAATSASSGQVDVAMPQVSGGGGEVDSKEARMNNVPRNYT
jgi:hypothetical protein